MDFVTLLSGGGTGQGPFAVAWCNGPSQLPVAVDTALVYNFALALAQAFSYAIMTALVGLVANGTDFDARGPGLIPHLLQHPSGLAKVLEVSQAFPHVEHPEGVSEGETVVVA